MVNVYTNRSIFEYDIHSLVKAFYQADEVKVSVVSDAFFCFSKEGCLNSSQVLINWDQIEDCLSVSVEGAFGECVSEKTNILQNQEKLYYKNIVKQTLYRVLSRHLNKKLPWGALTGIRPTRLAMDRLNAGDSVEATVRYMEEVYYTSYPKALLCTDIAKREKAIIDSAPFLDGYSLYVGIAFCPTTCIYCSFASNPIGLWKNRVSEYLDCLDKELDLISKLFSDRKLYTIYIGGGTPTALQPSELERLLSKIKSLFDTDGLLEYTVEAGRPDSITFEKLKVLSDFGVDRISVNPQTMNQKTLDAIGRLHTVEQTVEAFNLSRKAGFKNINMDLILGLPGEGMKEVSHTLSMVKELSPDSLTVHSLSVKRAAGLSDYVMENGLKDISITDEMSEAARQCAKELSLLPYYLYRQKNMTGNLENVGYAKEGCFGAYNILMMEEVQSIAAAGAGTISKRVFKDGRIERSENVKDMKNYLERIDEMLLRKEKLFSITC